METQSGRNCSFPNAAFPHNKRKRGTKRGPLYRSHRELWFLTFRRCRCSVQTLSGKYVFGKFLQSSRPENREAWIFAHIKLGRRVFLAQPNACRLCVICLLFAVRAVPRSASRSIEY